MKLTRKKQNKNLGCVTMYNQENNAYNNYQASQQLFGGWSGCSGGSDFDFKAPSLFGSSNGGGVAVVGNAVNIAIEALK